jgi:uncharacterized protein (TIGR02145 family)
MKNQFCDERDGKKYVYVTIGTGATAKVWMAENLNYNEIGSLCYNNQDSYCVTYGKMYDWATAMAFLTSCNSTSCASQINANHRGVCPSGWHIPSNAEWDQLFHFADNTNVTESLYSSYTAGKHLKATSGWTSNSGLDTYGFAAIPGGGYYSNDYDNVGLTSDWWAANEYNSNDAYRRNVVYNIDYARWDSHYKNRFFSVRCIQD